jgi:transposase
VYQAADRSAGKARCRSTEVHRNLGQVAPGLIQGAVLANSFATMVRDHHDTGFETWLEAARTSELKSFADGNDRDGAVVRAALTEPSSTNLVEGHITA